MRRLLVALILAAGGSGAVFAQEAPRRPTVFEQVIPNPTGENGYEELLLAGERLAESRLWKRVETRSATAPLELRRRCVEERPCREAVQLLRRGLRKPIFPPRAALNVTTIFPEMSRFRSMARFLAVREGVLMADGRTAEGVENLALGLRFSRAIQQETLIAGLVGVAVGAIVIQAAAPYLDQLNVRDCEALYRECSAHLATESVLPRLAEGELRSNRETVALLRNELRNEGPAAIQQLILDFYPHEEDAEEGLAPKLEPGPSPEAAALIRELDRRYGSTTEGMLRFLSDVEAELERGYREFVAELSRPFWEPRPARPDPSSPAEKLAAEYLPMFEMSRQVFATEDARVRLLAVHGAILRYRWEHDQVPASLAELDLGRLITDPHTGVPLEYQPLGTRRYLLGSAGPETTDENPRAVAGRAPVRLNTGE